MFDKKTTDAWIRKLKPGHKARFRADSAAGQEPILRRAGEVVTVVRVMELAHSNACTWLLYFKDSGGRLDYWCAGRFEPPFNYKIKLNTRKLYA